MGAWSTYSLEDFVMFAPRVYWRQFELANEALWPLPVAGLLLGAAILALALRPTAWSGRFIGIALGIVWLWVAWSFLWARYASINWAIAYVAPVFALQGLMLLFWAPAFAGSGGEPRRDVGLGLCVYALALHPLVAMVAGRPIQAAEVFAIAPDPTAIATLGLVCMAEGRAAWPLMILPLLWCLASALTLYAMGAPEAFVPLAAAVAAVAARTGLDRP
jgi:hypothetical protein